MTASVMPVQPSARNARSFSSVAEPAWTLPRREDGQASEHAARAGSVLVVEDDAYLSSALRIRMERAGLRVVSAFDGPSALTSYHTQRPDVVILDLNLPGMNGARVLQFVRSSPELRQVPVIAITGTSDPALHAKVREWGVTDLLLKPVSVRALTQSVLDALRYE